MVRQLFAHLIKNDLGLKLVADCTTVAEGTAALLKENPNLAHHRLELLPDGAASTWCATPGELHATRWILVSSNEQGQPRCARPCRSACTAS